MAIITTVGSSGFYVIASVGGTNRTLFTTPATANTINIVDIVVTNPAASTGVDRTKAYTLRVGPSTAIIVDNTSTGANHTVSWHSVSLIVT